jgi:4-phospho-D-threonate 3-dehydrogenase / 4-phospho-D-erythronate 3-dehydrogenase
VPKPVVAVTMGDPAGVGPEICLLSLTTPAVTDAVRPILIGDAARLELARTALSTSGRLSHVLPSPRVIAGPADAVFAPGSMELIDLQNVPPSVAWGKVSAGAGRAAFEYLQHATRLARAGAIDAICTAPLNKEAWKIAGVPFPGHTEALAHLSRSTRYAMMLVNGSLRVVHVSTHVALRKALDLLTVDRVLDTILLADEALKRYVVTDPRVALAGLNPHAGEGGLFGEEEATTLRPAVERARHTGVDVVGPLPPDTVFAQAAGGEFDAVIALYHDQGHIAVKMLGLDTGVNVTIGLPFLRTSVDHGTAFDIAGRGVAREASMIAALKTAAEFLAAGGTTGTAAL